MSMILKETDLSFGQDVQRSSFCATQNYDHRAQGDLFLIERL